MILWDLERCRLCNAAVIPGHEISSCPIALSSGFAYRIRANLESVIYLLILTISVISKASRDSDNVRALYLVVSFSEKSVKRGRSSLKRRPSSSKQKQSESRSSLDRSVHFSSPSTDNITHKKMPSTPFNRNSLGV